MDKNKHICKFCGKEFETGVKLGGHIVRCKKNPKYKDLINTIVNSRNSTINKNNPLEEHICKCQYCGNDYKVNLRHNSFIKGNYNKTCSSECAHKLIVLNSDLEEKNKKISKSMIGNIPSNRSENFSYYRKCKYCGNIFDIRIRNTKSEFCSDECMNKSKHIKLSEIAKKSNFGGYHPNSIKNHHKGNYKGIHCDSSWELAYLVYCLEHNIDIKRCNEVRTYIAEDNKIHRYFPDFVVDNKIIEIKGYFDKGAQIKSEQNPDIKVLLYDDLKESLEYTINKYGNKFWEVLYDK